MTNFKIQEILANDCYPIRKKVLRPHQIDSKVVFDNDDDHLSFHMGAFCNRKLIGVISILHDSPDIFRLRGMAIATEFQGQGVGKLLITRALALMPTNSILWCNARSHVIKFYQNFGFEIAGEEFTIKDTGPHVKMQVML